MTTTTSKASCLWDVVEYVKYTYSTVLLVFSIVLVMGCIFTGQTKGTAQYNIPPIVACILFWIFIGWLAHMEGGQGCLVGLKPIPPQQYMVRHPRTYKSCHIAHKGDNLERFIIGRQFLVVLVIFMINMMGEATKGANPFPLIPSWVNMIFLENSIAMMVTTVDVGQLPAQVNAAVAMLDFINNYIMLVTTYISLVIECSGLLHCVYLVQYGFAYLTKTKIDSNEPRPRSLLQTVFFWIRVLFSLAVLGFALAVTITALLEGKSGMWEGASNPAVALVIFFLLLSLVGLMEGMQIAAFALLNMSDDELSDHKIAHTNCKLMYEGTNLQSFLVGRQIFVAALMFIVARIATISIDTELGETNIFGVGDGFQEFLDTGLLGAIILTIIGSLAWRVIASSFPLLFMSNPLVYVIIRACFIIESTGVCSVAWLIALVCKTAFRLKSDDEYLDLIADDDDNDNNENGKDTFDVAGKDVENLRSAFASQKSLKSNRSMIFSSKDLRINNKDDDMKTRMSKMRNSFVMSQRMSAVISTRDLGTLMEEFGNIDEDGDNGNGNGNENDDDNDGKENIKGVMVGDTSNSGE